MSNLKSISPSKETLVHKAGIFQSSCYLIYKGEESLEEEHIFMTPQKRKGGAIGERGDLSTCLHTPVDVKIDLGKTTPSSKKKDLNNSLIELLSEFEVKQDLYLKQLFRVVSCASVNLTKQETYG